jgi:pimeloyl-ACP methyl ester carboxylesterase
MKLSSGHIKVYEKGDSNSQPILFIHGFPFDHNMWNKQINNFNYEYYCITYDVRGMGESPAGDGQYTMEMFVDDVECIITETGLEKPVLCGLSMGGYIALRAAERMEDKLGGLILCGTKSEADTNEGKLKRAEGIKRINGNGAVEYITEFITNCFSAEFRMNHTVEFEKIVERSLTFSPEGLKGCLLAMAARTDTTNYLPNIKIPVLLLCGEKDRLTPPPVMKVMADKISNSEFHIVPGSGHIISVENAEAVNEKISYYLRHSI